MSGGVPAAHARPMTNALPPTPPADHPSWDQPAPSHRPLLRSGTDRMAGGVAGGLGEYSGIDPVLWRVGFVALSLAGGAGVLIYVLLWVLVPSAPLPADQPVSPLEQFVGKLHGAINGSRAPGA